MIKAIKMSLLLLVFGSIFILSGPILAQGSSVQESKKVVSPEIAEAVDRDENIQASDLGLAEPRILPGTPLYFLKEMGREVRAFVTFDKVKKAELRQKFADEKLIEAKKIAMVKPEILPKALADYQEETNLLQEMTEKIKSVPTNSPADKFLDKFIDHKLKYQKLFGKLEKELPAVFSENIKNLKKESLVQLTDASLKLASPEVLQKKILKAMETQAGSDFKQFKNLEILQTIEEKVPETAKPAIREAMANSLQNLKQDLEKISVEKREKFKDYVINVGGNETRHLRIIDDFEREEVPKIVRDELEKAKMKILERAEEKLKEYPEAMQKEFLSPLTESGRMKDLRVVKEMENNLSSEVKEVVLAAKKEVKGKVVDNIVKAETTEQQKELFAEIENKYHDVQQLEVFKEIEELIPPENKELYDKMKERAMATMKGEIDRAKTVVNPEEKTMIMAKLAGDSPEHMQVMAEFKTPVELTKPTVEIISQKIDNLEDVVKVEILKNKLEAKEMKEKMGQVQPEILERIAAKSETLAKAVTEEQANWHIQQARQNIDSLKNLIVRFSPEAQAKLETANFTPLLENAASHLTKAESALRSKKYGEAFGQATASLNNSDNAREAMLKATQWEETKEKRNENWRKFLKEVQEKMPEVLPYSVSADQPSALPVSLLLACPLPPAVPAANNCQGKWQLSADAQSCPYLACVGETKESPCAGESQKVNRDPRQGLTNQKCCPNLNEIKISESYSVCKKGETGECLKDLDCPQPLCPGASAKCLEGKCIMSSCRQTPEPPVLPEVAKPVQESICPMEFTPAISPEGTCKRFFSRCYVPEGWKIVESCPEMTFAPGMIGCCFPGASMCVEMAQDKCLAEGGQGVPASYCDLTDVCFRLSTPAKIITSPQLEALPAAQAEARAEGCLEVSSPAISPEGICKIFSRSCEVPANWKKTDKCPEETQMTACCLEGGQCVFETKEHCLLKKGEPATTGSCSPNSCPECRNGATKYYQCADGTFISWCKCSKGKWDCLVSPEKNCPLKTLEPIPAAPVAKPPVPEVTECKAGAETKDYRCADGRLVSWCKCTAEGKLDCLTSPETGCPAVPATPVLECQLGEIKQYQCPDGSLIDSCKCTIEKKWDCLVSPEKSCSLKTTEPAAPATVLECKLGETKQYKCLDGTVIDSCKCTSEGKWDCLAFPENSCPIKATEPKTAESAPATSVTVECQSGIETKEYKCPDGTAVSWCKCTAEGKWDCLSAPEKTCPAATTL